MKKNISINISGIIFHIEEDAYEKLKGYLDSISSYFSSFDGSHEIIADIESRIAEIFLGKLDEDKQIITQEDVDTLISTMGSIADFQAVEEPDPAFESSAYEEPINQERSSGRKRLVRDFNRKILGGVCAGIAHYFNIDPIWTRLIFIALLIASWGSIAIVYIIMWIAVPKSAELPDDKKIKKMYRDTEKKVIAGVSSGIANYFGVEVAIIRIIFVLITIAFGTGILAYIILWIILPEAKSITDRVQMKGEAVTLSNIETNIKESMSEKDQRDENIFVKIFLFPFRLISTIITAIGKALGPIMKFLVDFIRVAFGMFVVFIGIVIVLSTLISFGATVGLLSSGIFHGAALGLDDISVPLELMADTFPVSTALAALMLILVPGLFLILLGSSMVAKRIIFSTSIGWTLFAIFIVSVILVSINVPGIAIQFREDGHHKVTKTYDLGDKTAVLKLNEIDLQGYDVTHLKLRGYNGDDYKLEQVFEAQGRTRKNAIDNAKMVSYTVTQEDSVLYFDSNIQFERGAVFRAQRLDMTLYIPYNKKFTMDYDLRFILSNTIYRYDYRQSQIDNNTWTFTENGLECLTCERNGDYSTRSYRGEDYDRSMVLQKFQAVGIDGPFKVDFIKSDEFKVLLKGKNEDLDDLEVNQDSDKIKINFKKDGRLFNKNYSRGSVRIMVLSPYINEIRMTSAAKGNIDNFRQKEMSIYLSGASELNANIYIEELEAELTGAAELELRGSGNEMIIDLLAASTLKAESYRVRNADIEAHAASNAKVYVTNTLEIEEHLASRIVNRGRAREVTDRGSSIDD